MSQARSGRKWRRDENQALADLALAAANRLSSSWASIGAELEARFPGRRPYTIEACRRRYQSIHGHDHHWTQQEKQTLAILCQDHDDDADIDWDDVAEQMRTIFESPRTFSAEHVRKRFLALRRSSKTKATAPADDDDDDGCESEGEEDKTVLKRRRSGSGAIRPAIVLEDGEFVPALTNAATAAPRTEANGPRASSVTARAAASSLAANLIVVSGGGDTATDVDENLRTVHELIKQHMQAMQKLSNLTDPGPDSLNDLVRAIAVDPLSDDDCDVLVQWSITCDAGNIARWVQYAERCDVADRLRWPIVVPARTLYMFQLIRSGRLAIVPDRVEAEMSRLHVRLRDQYLCRHSTLYRLVTAHQQHG